MTETYSIELPVQTKILTALAGLTLCIVSIIWTINLTTDLASTTQEKVLMGAIGFALEVCKFIFIPLGIALIAMNHWWKGASFLLVGLVLLLVSQVASLGFLTSRTNMAADEAKKSTDEYQISSFDINTIQSQIMSLSTAAEADSKSDAGYLRDRARSSQGDITALRSELTGAKNELREIEGEPLTSAGILFSSLATLFNSTPEFMKGMSYFVLSLLVEICALFSLSIAGLAHTHEHMVRIKPVIHLADESDKIGDEENAPHCTDRPSIADSVPRIENEARYRHIRKQVRCGALSPSTRALKNAGCSNEYSLDYLRRMAHEGLIERVGRGYQLVS